MTKVVAEQSVSLDGFSAGPNVRLDNGLGDGGERLHEWMFRDASRTAEIFEGMRRTFGAYVMGRRMFDVGEEPWGDEPPFHAPVFVVTHRPRAPIQRGETSFTFVTEGVADAVARAKAAAGPKGVALAGGATVIGQCLSAGVVDELRIHVVPIFLGAGTRLFDALGRAPGLEQTSVSAEADVAHLTYRVLRPA